VPRPVSVDLTMSTALRTTSRSPPAASIRRVRISVSSWRAMVRERFASSLGCATPTVYPRQRRPIESEAAMPRHVQSCGAYGAGSIDDIRFLIQVDHRRLEPFIPSCVSDEHWLMRTPRTNGYALSSAETSRPQTCSVVSSAGATSTSKLIRCVLVGAWRSTKDRSEKSTCSWLAIFTPGSR
jgi:hypothetical protein